MKSFATSVEIQASPEKVWQILTDLSKWTQWNTTVERTVGTVALNSRVTVFVKLSPGRGFSLKVTALDAPRRMVWADGMPFGLFSGSRIYELSAQRSDTVFSMREDYTGPLAGLIGRTIPDMQPAFVEFAECLKREAERR